MVYPAMKLYQHEAFAFGENRCVTLKPANDSPRAAIEALLSASENLPDLFESHPDIEADEPWFGWAFELPDGSVRHEFETYETAAADPELRPLIASYVTAVIEFFRATDGEPGFYVNEEEEAGSKAVEALVCADATEYLPLYLSFLKAIDLEHTCEQHSVVHRLAEVLSDSDLQSIREALSKLSGGEYFPEF
jgi:hypothetical protein